MIGTGHAQNAYQSIQGNNVFENKDFLVADEFVDSNGTNNTVNTGSSTATYFSSNFNYALVGDTSNTQNAGASAGSDNFTSTWTLTGPINSSQGYFSQIKQTYTGFTGAGTITITIKKGATTIATKTSAGLSGAGTYTATFTSADYSQLLVSGDTYSIVYSKSGTGNIVVGGVLVSSSGTYFSYTNILISTSSPCATFQERITDSSGTVIADTGTKTLDGTEKSICVYADKTTHITGSGDATDDTTNPGVQATDTTLSQSRGIRVKAKENLIVTKINKITANTASRALLLKDNGEVLSVANFSGNVATFTYNNYFTTNNIFRIEMDNSGSSYNNSKLSPYTYPVVGTFLDIEADSLNGADSTGSYLMNIDSVITQTATGPTNVSSITVDISDGTTTLLAQAFNTTLALTGFTSGTLKLTFNLATTDTTVTPTLKGYGVFIS